MRLIDTRTWELREFVGPIPPYAILSHRWENDEVTFQDMQHLEDETRSKSGFRKIQNFCRMADSRGYKYGWVDTCCINKADPTELGEAINSMFQWYQDSDICMVYLSDVFSTEPPEVFNSEFESSKWFSRGWTLQELLAPALVEFYSAEWHSLGVRTSCLEVLSRITGIAVSAFEGGGLGHFSIAQRMSWAAERKTTRVEDMAYCMLGIFDVNLPLLYGEGHKAFIRLQEEIIRISNDQSIFAWTADDALKPQSWSSALAPTPRYFKYGSEIEQSNPESKVNHFPFEREPFSVTNLGISITLPVVHTPTWEQEWWAVLDCYKDNMPLCIPLRRIVEGGSRYQRAMHPNVTINVLERWSCEVRSIYILLTNPKEIISRSPPSFVNGRWSTDTLEGNRIIDYLEGSTSGTRKGSSFSYSPEGDYIMLASCLVITWMCHIFMESIEMEAEIPVIHTFAILSSLCSTGSLALQARLFILSSLSALGISLETVSTILKNFWKQNRLERIFGYESSKWYSTSCITRYHVHSHEEVLRPYWVEGVWPLVFGVLYGGSTWCERRYNDKIWIWFIRTPTVLFALLTFTRSYMPDISQSLKQRKWLQATRQFFWLVLVLGFGYAVYFVHL